MSSARLHVPAATHRSHHQPHYGAGMTAVEMKPRSDDAGGNPSTTAMTITEMQQIIIQ